MQRTSDPGQQWCAYRSGASGAPGSAIPRSALDWEGRRFLAGGGAAWAAAAEPHAEPASEPVRVYVGTAHGGDAQARARLAVAELQRLCPVAPGLLVVGCPTGTGYVSPAALAAAELLTDGDCASVALQFGDQRSADSTGALDAACEHLGELLRRVAATTSAGWRPDRVLVWAESFGAWTLAAALDRDPGLLGAFASPVSIAWVGVPGPALADPWLAGQVERRVDPARRWNEGDRVEADAAGDVLLVHPNDPVAHVTGPRLALAPQRHDIPGPSGGERRYARRWLPLLTALRARREVDAATRPGARDALRRPHDYRYAAARVVAAALGLPAPTAAQERQVVAAELWSFDSFDRLGPDPVAENPWVDRR